MNRIRIAIADDQHLFREGLAALIQDINEFELIAEAVNGRDLLEQIQAAISLPDVALVDMNMPEMNGIEVADILHKQYPEIKVIILTVYDQERFISKMIEGGASGYLIKNCEIEELVLAIKAVHRTGFYLNDAAMNALQHTSKYKKTITNINNIPIEISRRELEVLHLICKERTNAEIANELFVSIRTVDGHRNNLLAKAGCRNTAGLVLFAVSNGLYEIGFS